MPAETPDDAPDTSDADILAPRATSREVPPAASVTHESRAASRDPAEGTPVDGDASDDEPGPVPRFDVGDDPARARRLLRLRVLMKSMVAAAFCVVVFVLFSAFLSGDDNEGTLPGMRVVIGDMAPGETRTLTWDGRAVLVHRRTPAEIGHLEDADGSLRLRLRDPGSGSSEQPASMNGALRSDEPEWFVAIGLGTDYGCPVAYLPPEEAPFAGLPWPGGFADSCRGSRYDLAGRVYDGQYADRNLVVPPHSIAGDTLLLGG